VVIPEERKRDRDIKRYLSFQATLQELGKSKSSSEISIRQNEGAIHRTKMRHPAAPTIIAVLLGFLFFMVLWSRARSDGHHEGNPHPDDLPRKKDKERQNSPNQDETDTAGAHQRR
jgi:hypothetical protein